MDVVRQIDLKLSSTRWSKIFRRTSSNLANYKERRVSTNILPLVDTNGSVKEPTLFLPGLAPLQSSRTKSSVAWLVFVKFVWWIIHQWRTSAIPLKTSQVMWCDTRRPTNLHIPNQSRRLNTTATSPPIGHQVFVEAKVTKWRSQQLWPTMTLGLVG
jgi:hypothetical protein